MLRRRSVLLANTTDAKIENNVIAGAAFAGIQVGFRTANPVTGADIFKNVVTGTRIDFFIGALGAGIALARGSSGSTVKENIVTGSAVDGIFVGVIPFAGGSSSGNAVEQNISDGKHRIRVLRRRKRSGQCVHPEPVQGQHPWGVQPSRYAVRSPILGLQFCTIRTRGSGVLVSRLETSCARRSWSGLRGSLKSGRSGPVLDVFCDMGVCQG